MKPATPVEELRATIAGEVRRARERTHELARITATLSESMRDAVDVQDAGLIASRLQVNALGGVVVLNELAFIAGRLAALEAMETDA